MADITRAQWAAIAASVLAVTIPPAWLAWSVVRPAPWDSHTLRVRFESVRYEGAGLTFTYSVQNRVWRKLQLLPDQMDIQAVAAGRLPPGHAAVRAPLILEGHSTERVEVRMELPMKPMGALAITPADRVPEAAGGCGGATPPTAQPAVLENWIDDVLRNLNGFELIDGGRNVHLRFPRGW